jgi:hypothetical protein
MNGKILWLAVAMFVSSSSFAFTDSLWIVGAEGYAGGPVTCEVWIQYEGEGVGDSISAFDIPLTYNATVCTVETITIGTDFAAWTDRSRIDNQGIQGPPAFPKIGISAFTLPPFGPPPIPRGTHLAAIVEFRILADAEPSDSTCLDTLMQAFADPLIHLAFVEKSGHGFYVPSFSTGCLRAWRYPCGDCNHDGRVTIPDALYLIAFIYRDGDPVCEEHKPDVNLDGRITIADATYIAGYVYRDGPEPCNPP